MAQGNGRHAGLAESARRVLGVEVFRDDDMTSPMIPRTYEQWRHCITVDCGIPLTRKFVEDRLLALQAPAKEEARRFAQLYGESHLQQVRAWFEQAYRALQQVSPRG